MIKKMPAWFIFVLILITWPLHAETDTHPDVKKLLKAPESPGGVVIELLDWGEKSWQWATPAIAKIRKQLQTRFPQIDIAVVSHGGEQFQLTKNEKHHQPLAIQQLQQLNAEGVNVHVCGTHSSWQDIPETAYLDFVDVSPSGPAQVNDYIKLGYHHILLRKPL
ncbi:MAG: DsrE family protein [Gammaproteobacteria bacterium]|nr:DsrE family protein [Gammaproteobacteria bacterium]